MHAAYATSCARETSVGWSTPACVLAARLSSSVRRTPTCDDGSRKLSTRSLVTCCPASLSPACAIASSFFWRCSSVTPASAAAVPRDR